MSRGWDADTPVLRILRMGRKNKSFPLECSSKQPVSVLRQVFEPVRPKAIDPRFDRAFGSFHEDQFKEAYSFVKDIQKSERKTLEDSLKTERDPRKITSIRRALDRQNSIARSKEQSDFKHRVLQKWKQAERELIADGKKPFHLKKSDENQLMLIAKFKDMKDKAKDRGADGGFNIEKMVEKRRKHKAAKQHIKMPRRDRDQ